MNWLPLIFLALAAWTALTVIACCVISSRRIPRPDDRCYDCGRILLTARQRREGVCSRCGHQLETVNETKP